jgi:hypothetical protein
MRKNKRNIMKSGDKNVIIKQLNAKPVIKNVDVEAIKASFREKKAAAGK